MYYSFNPCCGVRSTILLDNVKLIHITRMDEPYVDHKCIQVVYLDETTITIFAPTQEFTLCVEKLYEDILLSLDSTKLGTVQKSRVLL